MIVALFGLGVTTFPFNIKGLTLMDESCLIDISSTSTESAFVFLEMEQEKNNNIKGILKNNFIVVS
jgi:hypothetical protein